MDVQSSAWDTVAKKVIFTLDPDLGQFSNYVSRSDKILDYGCGYGRITLALHNLGYSQIIGYDTSAEMIARGIAEAPTLSLKSYSPPTIPEANNSFDAIICCAVLTCLPDPELQREAIKEITRILRPGGVLYMAEFLRTSSINYNRKQALDQMPVG